MRNSLILYSNKDQRNRKSKKATQGVLELNNMLNLKTASLYVPILHYRPYGAPFVYPNLWGVFLHI